MDEKTRCPWPGDIPVYVEYHDHEWGRPVHDDRKLFEMLILEGMQAGLSWITVLKKREAYRRAFDGFDPEKIARYDEAKIQELMADPGIIRNRLKIRAAVTNAKAFSGSRSEARQFRPDDLGLRGQHADRRPSEQIGGGARHHAALRPDQL